MKKKIVLVQYHGEASGTFSYFVKQLTNCITPRVGDFIKQDAVQDLIDVQKVEVVIKTPAAIRGKK